MADAALSPLVEPALEPAQPLRAPATARLYDAFISYSHAKDKALAAALQSAMQRLGKPWYRRRALRLFRDDTSLTATPHLWPSIEGALGQSRFLILMASPEAAASPWVDKELATWLGHNEPDTLLIALADGELDWDGDAGDFRWSEVTPLPPSLKGRFADEPRWIDLRPYRDGVRSRDARFADLAADFAATLHGRPKEDLLSQEVRQQRRALRLAGSAVALLIVLLALAGWQWTVAESAKRAAIAEQKIAEAQRNRAEHNLSVATEAANDLIYDMAQKFRDSGVPVSIIEDILERARQLQKQLTADGQISDELQHSEAAALNETVRTLLTIGDTKGALAAAQQEQKLSEALLASDPANLAYQAAVSADDESLGRVLAATGDAAGALAKYRTAELIDNTLTAKDSSNTDWQHALAVNHIDIGDVFYDQGQLSQALPEYRAALAIGRKLVAKDAGVSEWQTLVAAMNDRVGLILSAEGDLGDALSAYSAGLAISEEMAATNPLNTVWQHGIESEKMLIGDALAAQKNLPAAIATYREALAIAQKLANSDRGNAEWLRDLASVDQRIGHTLRDQGDLSGGLAAFQEFLTIMKALTAKDPSNTEWLVELADAEDDVGDIMDQQHSPGTLQMFSDALAIRRAQGRIDPTNVPRQIQLVKSLINVYSESSDRSLLEEALTILNKLAAAGTLPSDEKPWIAKIEAELAKPKP